MEALRHHGVLNELTNGFGAEPDLDQVETETGETEAGGAASPQAVDGPIRLSGSEPVEIVRKAIEHNIEWGNRIWRSPITHG